MGIPDNYDKLTPGAQVEALSGPAIDRKTLTRYLTLGADRDILRTARASLPVVRSGVAFYLRFCHLLARPYFPPTDDTVQLWSSTFNPGKTFNQYLYHLQMASTLMNMRPD